MNIKRYQAAAMREALEKVKNELGDEALVLGSKQVRGGGFLGLGGQELVKVRVSSELLPPKTLPKAAANRSTKSTFTGRSFLSYRRSRCRSLMFWIKPTQ